MEGWREKIKDIPSVETLDKQGIGKTAVIVATGWSYLDYDYNKFDTDVIFFEINKMRLDRKIDYSIYYDYVWKNYFIENDIGSRKLIGFAVHVNTKVDYWYDTHMVVFSDTGFHALYIVSEIMKFDKILLFGYDYYQKNGKWHPYDDDYIDEVVDEKKHICLEANIRKYNDIDWYSNIYNCNKRSALKVFPFININ